MCQFKKVISMVLLSICLCAVFNSAAFADTTSAIGNAVPLYDYVDNAVSKLWFNKQTAYCTSEADASNAARITVEQTLEKYSGWFWIWNDVDNASWSGTEKGTTISFVNTISGLDSGTYRLRSVFTLTTSDGKTETITVYSEEKSC